MLPACLVIVRVKIRQGESSREWHRLTFNRRSARARDQLGPAYFLAFFLVDFFAVFFLAVFLAAAISWLLRVWRLLVRPSHLPGRHERDDVVCRKLDK